nr:carbohydrate kinase family protein [uncultured Lichenicoccus sp.]
MAARRGFVSGGCWCFDRNKTIAFWPEEDQSVSVQSVLTRGGGSACNFGIGMRRLDPAMPVETIGLVGDDEEGRFLIKECDRHGIDRTQLHVTRQARTHLTDAYCSERSGRRTHFFEEGTSARLTPAHFDLSSTTGRVLHLGLPGIHRQMDAPTASDANGWVTVLRAARNAGLRTNLELVTIDPDRLARLARPCLPLLDTLVVNDYEIGALAGLDTVAGGLTDIAACLHAARVIMEQGSMAVLAVHYTMGAFAISRDGSLAQRGSVTIPPDLVAGANGAGDAFAAGFLRVMHDDGALDDALALGHATAAASLRHVATTDSIETRERCLALAEGWGWR